MGFDTESVMRRLRFILSAHPYAMERGDAAVTRIVLEVAAGMAQIRASALWSGPATPSPFPIACVPRPPVRLARLSVRSLLTGRSLLHTRFNERSLVQHLRDQDDDAFVAVHAYMAEPFLSAFPQSERAPLYVNYVVSESDVLKMSARWNTIRSVEARRTWRDDVRSCAAAAVTATFSRPEAEDLSSAGLSSVELLRIVFPPLELQPSGPGPHLLFLGDRTWYPNFDGLRRLCGWWPEIARRVPGARLLVVGTGPVPDEARRPGVDVLGFVSSLDTVWADARALVVPLTVGGGVRVKILEAAARGVPVIASTAAIGSLHEYLPLRPVDERDVVIDACVGVLTDAGAARGQAEALFEANRAWWTDGHFHDDVRRWLQL